MSNVKPFQKSRTDSKNPENIGRRAEENLAYIRSTIERGMQFTSVPGYGGVLMGLTAIGASLYASRQERFYAWLFVWISEALLAVAIGCVAIWRKAAVSGESLASMALRKFVAGFLPAVVAAIVLTAATMRFESREILAIIWTLLYGSAVVAGGAFSVTPVRAMGWSFILSGIFAALVLLVLMSPISADLIMALTFGVLHIVFGGWIAKNYGG